jgi:PAS domain S-box-containing protein
MGAISRIRSFGEWLTRPRSAALNSSQYDEIRITAQLMLLAGLFTLAGTALYGVVVAAAGSSPLPLLPLSGSALFLLWSSQAVRSGDVVRPLTIVALGSTGMIVLLALIVGGFDGLRMTELFTGIMLFGVVYLPLRTLTLLAAVHILIILTAPFYVPAVGVEQVFGLYSPLWLVAMFWGLALPLAWFHRRAIRVRERAVEYERGRYQQLVEDLPDPLIVLRPDGLVLEINQAARAVNGLRPGDNALPIIQERVVAEDIDPVMKMLCGQFSPVPGRSRLEVRSRDPVTSQQQIYEISPRLNHDERGQLVSITLLGRDVTERRQMEAALRASEMRYRILSEMMIDYAMCFIHRPDGSLEREWVTDSYFKVVGISPDASADLDYSAMLHPDDRQRWTYDWFALLAGEERDGEYRVNRGDGREQWVYVRRRVITEPDGSRRFYIIGRDITVRVQMERQRIALAVEQERYQTIARFISAISHDFRTRLSSIETNRHLVQRLVERSGIRQTAPQIIDKLSAIEEIVRYLGEQLDHMGLIALAHEPRRQPFPLAELLRSVDSEFGATAAERGIRLAYAVPQDLPPVLGDPDDLRRAIVQIVRNAVQHTPAGGTVLLRAELFDNRVRLLISDTGAGIAADDLPYIFDPFFRGDRARSTDSGGIGLGLTVARMIALMNGGDIEAASAPGSGTTIALTLPTVQLAPSVV